MSHCHHCVPLTRWWVGEWQPCSRSCGPEGLSRRAVFCIRSVGLDEQRALEPSACEHLPRPLTETPCNRYVTCPSIWGVGNWSQCSVTCGAGIRQRSVLCINNTDVPCDEAERPITETFCFLQSCQYPMYIVDTGASGSGSSSPELFNEVDFIPNQLAPRPSPASSPKPVSISNAIDEEDLELDPPGPVFVDDFYYDYNFINFHEDLSYGSFEEPHSDLVDIGGRTAPPHIRPTEQPSDTPVPTAGAPGAEEEDIQGSWSPSPLLSEASHSPPVLEQTPVNPLANFLTEEDTPIRAPELGFPSLPWLPASVDDMVTSVALGNPDESLVRDDRQSQPSTPWSDRNTLSRDGNPLGHTSPALPQSPIPTQPSSTSVSTTQASLSPDVVEVSTGGNVARDPLLEADL